MTVDDLRLAARFARLSGHLLGEEDEELTFDRVVRRAVEVIPGCDAAGIMLRKRRGRAETVASTRDIVNRLDALQMSLGEGPCLDAAFDRQDVVVEDLARERRWPRWARAAQEAGIGAAIAIRLHTDTETLGALNLFSTRRAGFDEESADIALIFASHATEAMSKARLVTGLRAALESRHAIGVAQGVLAVRYGISYERAFEVLNRYSNDNNVKLREVALQVLEDRALPTGTGSGAEPLPLDRD